MQSQVHSEIYSDKDRLKNVDPRLILLIFLSYIVTLYPASLARPIGIMMLVSIPVLMVYLTRIPIWKVVKIIGKIYPVILLVSLFQIAPFITMGSGSLGWINGEQPFAAWITIFDIQIKSLLLIAAGVILMATLSFTRILQGFQELRVPRTLISVMFFIYRFVFLLLRELNRLIIAYKSRYVKLSIWRRISTVGKISAVLITRIFNFQENMFQALVNRGFKGEFLFEERLIWRRWDSIMLLTGVLVLLFIRFWL